MGLQSLIGSFMLLSIAGTAPYHVQAGKCRMENGASHDGCALPYELGNFQGKSLLSDPLICSTIRDIL